MKGFRFYAVMPEARGSKSATKANPLFPWTVKALQAYADSGGRVDIAAVILDERGRPCWQGATQNMDAFTTAIEGDALSYCVCGVSREFLASRCTRIPETLARALSPELFTRLES